MGAQRYEVVDGSLRALEQRAVVLAAMDAAPFNPGITPAVVIRMAVMHPWGRT